MVRESAFPMLLRRLVFLAVMALWPASAFAQIVTVTLGTPNNFLPSEGTPVTGSQAKIRFTISGSAGTYRVQVLDSTGTIVENTTVEKTSGSGTPQAFTVAAPLVEGSQTFQVRVTGVNVPGTATSPTTNPIVRELLKGVSRISLDAVAPNTRVTNGASTTLIYTLSGTSGAYRITVERNGVALSTFNVTQTGEQQTTVPLDTNDTNIFQMVAESADLGADPTRIERSRVLAILQDSTNPTITNLRVTSTTNPTADATVSVQGRTEAFAGVTIDNGIGGIFTTESDITGNFTVNGVFLDLNPPGPTINLLTAEAVDQAGNTSGLVPLQVTRTNSDPAFTDLRLEPASGSFLLPEEAVEVSGSAVATATPFGVNFLIRTGTLGGFDIEEKLTDLDSPASFLKDIILSPLSPPPRSDVVYSIQVEGVSSTGATRTQLLGSVTLDLTDPEPPSLPLDVTGRLFTNARLITLQGQAERFATVEFDEIDGLQFQPSRFAPVGSSPALEGGEWQQVLDVSGLLDGGPIAFDSRTVARSGRSSGASIRQIQVTRDVTAARIDRLEANDVDVDINRPLFLRESQLVRFRIFVDEPMPLPPDLVVTEPGRDGIRAVLEQTAPGNQSFEYVYVGSVNTSVTVEGISDGPVEVVVSGGSDRAGNPIPEEIFPQAVVKDSLAPDLVRTRVRPTLGLPLQGAPAPLVIEVTENALSATPASGVDVAASVVEVFGPIQTDPDLLRPGTVFPFSPGVLEFRFAAGTVLPAGTYQVRVRLRDFAGNVAESSLLIEIDDEAIDPRFLARTDPPNNSCVNRDTFPRTLLGTDAVSATFDPIILSEVNLPATTMAVSIFCPERRAIAGTTSTITPDSVVFNFDRPLRDNGSDDGVYVIETFLTDRAGNVTPFLRSTFIYDTELPNALDGEVPFPVGTFGILNEDGFFPKGESIINGPLRVISSDIVDGVSRNNYTGSGINTDPTTGTSISLTLLATHPTTTLPVGASTDITPDLRSTRIFESFGDPEFSPCFIGLRRKRVLLQLRTDPVTGVPLGLRTDGTQDGRYGILVFPVDCAGNQGIPTASEFVYDTIPPTSTIDRITNDEILMSNGFAISGTAADNRKPPDDRGQGVKEILITLERNDGAGSTSLPPLIPTTAAILPDSLPFISAATPIRWHYEGRIVEDYEGRARLIVRVRDAAGNVTDIIRDIVVNTRGIPAPKLRVPADDSFLSERVIRFEWDQVDQAAGYRLTLTDPNGDIITSETGPQENFATLTLFDDRPEGVYTWLVEAVDTRGVAGKRVGMFRFTLDLTPPTILSFFGYDPVLTDTQGGTILGNQIRVGVTFSEPMGTATTPTVLIDPASVLVPEIPLTNITYQVNEYRGLVNLTPRVDSPDPNGIARVRFLNTVDRAGNPLNEEFGFFEVNLGPFFEVRAFGNPIHRRELKFHFRAMEFDGGPATDLIGIPFARVTQADGLPQVLAVTKVTNSVYAGTYAVDPTRSGTATVEVHGANEQGNSVTRKLTFRIQAMPPLATASVRRVSDAFFLRLPGSPVRSQGYLATLPATFPGGRVGPPLPPGGELTLVKPLETLITSDPVPGTELEVDLAALGLTQRRLGLFQMLDEGARFIPSVREGDKLVAPLEGSGGSFALMADMRPPAVTALGTVGEGRVELRPGQDLVEVSIHDPGAGVEEGSLVATVDGRAVAHAFDPEQQRMRVLLPGTLASGEHALVVAAGDRLGNVAEGRYALVAPASLEVLQFVPVPNPAGGDGTTFRYRLSTPAREARLAIHDTTGKIVRQMDGPADAGVNQLFWDLTDRKGRLVGNGIYFVRLRLWTYEGKKVRVDTKVAVLR